MSVSRTVRLIAVAFAAAAALLATALALAAQPAAAAQKKCVQGKSQLVAKSSWVRVVKVKGNRRQGETRHENLYACWKKTGRRVLIGEEVDHGEDLITRIDVTIIRNRYVGVIEEGQGGVSSGREARTYDVQERKLLHRTQACDSFSEPDFAGVKDVVFLDNGGMAFACDSLYLYRSANAAVETLEAPGTDVRQLAISAPNDDWVPRLYWTVGDTVKSITL